MKTTKFDAASYLDTEEKIAAYLNEVMEVNDPALTAEAIGTVAKARGMSEIARQANVTRESLYRSLSLKGNPELKTVAKVLGSLGMQLRVVRTSAIAGTRLAKPAKKAAVKRAAAKTARKPTKSKTKKPAKRSQMLATDGRPRT